MMKNPPHPGQGLKDEIETLGLSVAQFARALGVTRQQLYRLINGDSGITPEMAVRLENNVLVTETGQVDLMAGVPIEVDEIEQLMAHGR